MAPWTEPRASSRPAAWVYVLVGLVAALVYANTLANGFVYDDTSLIVENPRIGDWSNVPHLFRAGWRPLKRVSLMVDHALYGLHPTGYHATNVGFHTAATLAVTELAVALGGGPLAAATAGLVFATHPIHTEAIAVITHRKEPMGTLFLVLALLVYIRRKRTLGTALLVFLLFAASILSKEIVGACFPVVLAAYALFYDEEGGREVARKLWPAALLLVPTALGVGALVAVRSTHQGTQIVPYFDPIWIRDLTEGVTSEYVPVLSSALRALWVNVRLLLLPVGLSADHTFRISTRFEPLALVALVGLVALIGIALRLRHTERLVSFGILWVPLTLLPGSNVIPLTPWFVAERFLYLPSVGLALAIGGGVAWARARMKPGGRRLLTAALVALVLVFAALSVRRNRDWRDDETIWSLTVRQSPGSLVAHSALAATYQRLGNVAGAVEQNRAVLVKDPANLEAITNLGDGLTKLGQVAEAQTLYERALPVYGDDARIRNNLGNCYKKLGRPEDALQQYLLAVKLDPDLAEAHVNIGAHLARAARPAEAAQSFERAIAIDDTLAAAHLNLAIVRMMQGQQESAIPELRRALALPAADVVHAEARKRLEQLGVAP